MKKLAFMAAVACMAAGCSSTDGPKEPEPVICQTDLIRPTYEWNGSRSLKDVAEGNADKANAFAAELFRTIYDAHEGNICVSPASVFCTFAMMANGDDGESRDEILEMLGYGKGDDALSGLNVYANALLKETSEFDGNTQCGFTNSIWHHPDLNVLPDFSRDIEKIFGGIIVPIWIGDEKGKTAINQFVCNQTRGMITEFLKLPLPERLAFLNTTYFKGAWETAFDKELTEDRKFTNLDGSKTDVSFMSTWENVFEYAETDGVRALRLPYKDERYSMTILQPLSGKKDDFQDMLRSLDSETIARFENSMQRDDFILRMPGFETEINMDIMNELCEMGIDKTCSRGLPKVADEPLSLNAFLHAVKITVDEEGTEAGAVSLGGLCTSAGPGFVYSPTIISVDSPFVYMIRDTVSGTVLFMGAITKF